MPENHEKAGAGGQGSSEALSWTEPAYNPSLLAGKGVPKPPKGPPPAPLVNQPEETTEQPGSSSSSIDPAFAGLKEGAGQSEAAC